MESAASSEKPPGDDVTMCRRPAHFLVRYLPKELSAKPCLAVRFLGMEMKAVYLEMTNVDTDFETTF